MSKQPPAILKAPPWDESMGRVPYHYADKPAGHRCLWTARWLVACNDGKRITTVVEINPDWSQAGWEPSKMTRDEIVCELEDIVASENFYAQDAARIMIFPPPEERWRQEAEGVLMVARHSYQEYVAEWAGARPEAVFRRVLRPGWEGWNGDRPVRTVRLGER